MNWNIISDNSSSIIALAALLFSIISFWKQQQRAKLHATASVKPILSIRSLKYLNLKAIELVNNGIGPAIIRKAIFSKDNISTNKIVELFDLDIIWETFLNIPAESIIPPQRQKVLIKQSARHLEKQNYKPDDALSLLEEWQKQKSGIQVYIEYEDIYGNQMKPLQEILT